jgi:AAA15 family ATPase/GTPase
MIKSLHIRNFKSIKDLKLDCARVNLFIGEPNTGKSNILESVGVFSIPEISKIYSVPRVSNLQDLIRIEKNFDIFYNQNTDEDIQIELFLNDGKNVSFGFKYHSGVVLADCINNESGQSFFSFELPNNNVDTKLMILFGTNLYIRYYKFKELNKFSGFERDYLTPPFGDNLPQIITQKTELKEFISSLFKKVGWKVEISKRENIIKVYREEHIAETIPFFLTSDTLQRMVFYNAAITSNKDATLIFEEPESHMFPFYTEQLALMIADNSNQFFIATHNPYFLNMLINKTKAEELRVFKVTYKDYQTIAKPIDKKILQNFVINDNDILLNIDRLGEDE